MSLQMSESDLQEYEEYIGKMRKGVQVRLQQFARSLRHFADKIDKVELWDGSGNERYVFSLLLEFHELVNNANFGNIVRGAEAVDSVQGQHYDSELRELMRQVEAKGRGGFWDFVHKRLKK